MRRVRALWRRLRKSPAPGGSFTFAHWGATLDMQAGKFSTWGEAYKHALDRERASRQSVIDAWNSGEPFPINWPDPISVASVILFSLAVAWAFVEGVRLGLMLPH